MYKGISVIYFKQLKEVSVGQVEVLGEFGETSNSVGVIYSIYL